MFVNRVGPVVRNSAQEFSRKVTKNQFLKNDKLFSKNDELFSKKAAQNQLSKNDERRLQVFGAIMAVGLSILSYRHAKEQGPPPPLN